MAGRRGPRRVRVWGVLGCRRDELLLDPLRHRRRSACGLLLRGHLRNNIRTSRSRCVVRRHSGSRRDERGLRRRVPVVVRMNDGGRHASHGRIACIIIAVLTYDLRVGLRIMSSRHLVAADDPDDLSEHGVEVARVDIRACVPGVRDLIQVVADALELVDKRNRELVHLPAHDLEWSVLDQVLDIACTGEAEPLSVLGDQLVGVVCQACRDDFRARLVAVRSFTSHRLRLHAWPAAQPRERPGRMGPGKVYTFLARTGFDYVIKSTSRYPSQAASSVSAAAGFSTCVFHLVRFVFTAQYLSPQGERLHFKRNCRTWACVRSDNETQKKRRRPKTPPLV